jgi:ligand-binding sensor domain-containing protein
MINFVKIFLVFIFISNVGLAQDIRYSYTNYTLKDGLAGNNVYCSVQDKEGFIWFGTETGLSRFDGTHFKNYTIKDGLPDNEIIEMFCDSKGRVWFAPFKKSICYYYKGKIYNQENEKFLKTISLRNSVIGFCEDNEGNVYLNQRNVFSIIKKNNTIENYDNVNGQHTYDIAKMEKDAKVGINFFFNKQFVHFNNSFNTKINIKQFGVAQNSYGLSEKYFVADGDNPLLKTEFKFIYNLDKNKLDSIKSDHKYNSHNIIDDSLLAVNRPDGCIMYHLNNLKNLPDTFLYGISIGRVNKDNEGEFWFLSMGHGVFKLASKNIYNFKKNVTSYSSDISFIKKLDNKIYLANNEGEIFESDNDFKTYKLNRLETKNISFTKLIDIISVKNHDKIYCVPKGFFAKDGMSFFGGSLKEISIINDSILLAVSSANIYFLNFNTLIFDGTNIIWKERATSVLYSIDSIFVGSLNGLFVVKNDKSNYSLSKIDKIFERRISAIKKGPDATIWVGTYDAGVVAYKNGKVVQVFNDSNGLTSNICRNLFVNGNYLWVGTDKGLNKIDISKPPYKILINYTTTDGLASNMINAVYTDSNMLYVGTPEGLTFFDETKIVNDSTCDMRILGISVSGKEQPWDSSKIILHHKDNNIRFDFVGLSFKSAGDITYSYRLVGLDNEWKTTRENYLEYPSLPSGNYALEIYATNKFGVKSEVLTIDFEIEKRLVEKLWFRLLLLLLTLGAIYFYFNRRINTIKTRAREKVAINDKLNEMEQMALRSQMNPHFIFNCLNSIQDYVISGDVQGANKFITDFSRLIRNTLDNSSKKTISIVDEITYLTNYLTIEQYRFENKFEFSIYVDNQINKDDNHIPPMLLQPYVENAIRHGINNKKEGVGLIQINILKQNNNLICEIIDNGIGRKAALALKGNTAIEYQSKGMELTAKRIQLLNKNIGEDIVIKIEDVQSPKIGTKVTVSIPMV